MKARHFLIALLVLMLAVGASIPFLGTWNKTGMDRIVSMARDGASEEDMLVQVDRQAGSSFKLSADDVVKLKTSQVPDRVVIAMLRKTPAEAPKTPAPKPDGDR